MKKQNFLNKVKKEGKIELVEPSEEICKSYLRKADNCLKSAKILLQNMLYENSISNLGIIFNFLWLALSNNFSFIHNNNFISKA